MPSTLQALLARLAWRPAPPPKVCPAGEEEEEEAVGLEPSRGAVDPFIVQSTNKVQHCAQVLFGCNWCITINIHAQTINNCTSSSFTMVVSEAVVYPVFTYVFIVLSLISLWLSRIVVLRTVLWSSAGSLPFALAACVYFGLPKVSKRRQATTAATLPLTHTCLLPCLDLCTRWCSLCSDAAVEGCW